MPSNTNRTQRTARIVGAVAGTLALTFLITGCGAPSFKSDDGKVQIETTLVARTKVPGQGEVCIVGIKVTNDGEEFDLGDVFTDPSQSQVFGPGDLVILEEDEVGDYSIDGWNLGFWGRAIITDPSGKVLENRTSIRDGESAALADMYPCDDLGSDYAFGVAKDIGTGVDLVQFKTPKE